MRDAELEAAIIADPESPAAYEVYADWLLERGEPRGELVTVQLERERAPTDPALAARERALLAPYVEALDMLGRYASAVQVTWRRGFIDSAVIRAHYESGDAATSYAELAAMPVAALLRRLEIGAEISHHGRHGGVVPDDASVLEAMRAHPLRDLRSLSFSAFDHDISWTHVGELAVAGDALASVEELSIDSGRMRFGPVALPRLRSLQLITGGLPAHVLADLAAQTWPHLTRLHIWLGTENYDGSCTAADIQPLLDGDVIPAVDDLALCNYDHADELVGRIVRANILARLRKLDLSKGTLGPAGAQLILRHAGAFAHLESLDLSENYLAGPTCAQLANICAAVDLRAQKTEDQYGRFVSLGE